MKLLIVDDSSIIRRAIQKYVQSLDLEVVGEAGNGEEALRIFRDTKPELVTMDITMPEMDGLTCIDEIMKIDSGTKVLVISALNDEDTALQALEKGARGFIAKPFDANSLFEALQRLMK